MTKSKLSALYIVVSSIFVIHLARRAQFLNGTCVSRCPVIAISPLTKI